MSFRNAGGISLTLTPFVALYVCAIANASPRVTLDPSRCTAITQSQKLWLPLEWQPFTPYTRVCAVRERSGAKPVLRLISIFATEYYKNQPGKAVQQIKMPEPILFSLTGQILGRLPFNFPDDPPTELRVTFCAWKERFPQRIDLFLKDPAVLGNRTLPPLIWDSTKGVFERHSKEK